MGVLLSIYWDVNPVIFRTGTFEVFGWPLGPLALRWYGLLFALGFLIGFYIVRYMFLRERRPESDLEVLLFYLLGGTIIGARLGHVFFYHPGYYLAHPTEIPAFWEGGLASHGGLLGILVALGLYAWSRPRQPYLWLLDRVAVPTALVGSFIRLGNLFNAEILGTPSDLPWAFVFARVDTLPRHPAQLYESLAYLLVFGLLLIIYRRYGASTPRGLLSGLFLVLVFSARFLIEYVKVEQAAFAGALPLQMGQLLSLPAIVAGGWLLARSRRSYERS